MVQRTALLVTLGMALVGCGLMEGVGTAERAVATFHEQYNAGSFGEMYDASAEDLRATDARNEFVSTMTSLRTKLGSIRGTARIGFDSRIDSSGTFVALSTRPTSTTAWERRNSDGRSRMDEPGCSATT